MLDCSKVEQTSRFNLHSQKFLPCSPCVAAPLVAPRNLTPAGRERFVSGLLSQGCYCSAARRRGHTRVRFVRSGTALSGSGEESSPAPSKNETQNEHDRKPHREWMPDRYAVDQPVGSTGKILKPTAGMENRFASGMPNARITTAVRKARSGSSLLEDTHRDTSILQS